MNDCLVSILLPCYNVESFLSQCLESLTYQTHRHLQIILIDDGSTDNTWQIMQEYAAKDSRIEIYHQDNQGVATTRNHLLEKVKGEYVLFVDSDDWVELDMVEFLVRQIEQEQADIVTCGMVVNDTPINQVKVSKECWNQEKVIYEFLRHVSFSGSLWNKLLKSSLLHNIQFHCGISYGEDALFVWNVLQRVQRVVFTDKILYHYRKNSQSISRQQWKPDKKGTGHMVWQEICSDVELSWCKYLSIARARFALEDMWGLYFAALANYKYDSFIQIRQDNIRANLIYIKSSKLDSLDKYWVAWILCRWYGFGALLRVVNKLKGR